MKPAEVTPSRPPMGIAIVPRRSRLSWWAPPRRVPARLIGFLWGSVFLLGGVAVWMSAPRGGERPSAWSQTGASSDTGLDSGIRAHAGEPGILRLEWPAHPSAESYRLRFKSPAERRLPPVTLQGTVFLYDLKSDVLDLPDSFEWEVAAVLRDGSEIVTTPHEHPER